MSYLARIKVNFSDFLQMLSLQNVAYHPPSSPYPILQGINLELPRQKLGLIVGSSGSGKTTLLEILAGFAEHTQGTIGWKQNNLGSLELQELSGLVFQFPERHFCGSTILEELRLGHPQLSAERIKKALDEVGLEDISQNTSPYSLSGGQQRRLALAVQLIREPNLLLLDEPTAGLDWSMRRQLTSLLAKLKEHWTLIVVSHDSSELLEIADYCWKIDQGKLEPIALNNDNTSLLAKG